MRRKESSLRIVLQDLILHVRRCERHLYPNGNDSLFEFSVAEKGSMILSS